MPLVGTACDGRLRSILCFCAIFAVYGLSHYNTSTQIAADRRGKVDFSVGTCYNEQDLLLRQIRRGFDRMLQNLTERIRGETDEVIGNSGGKADGDSLACGMGCGLRCLPAAAASDSFPGVFCGGRVQFPVLCPVLRQYL